jgi:glycosyltransferase involved in cell wall biosynthesis
MYEPEERRCLSVVVPCYDEYNTVQDLVERVLDSPWVAEVIIVDDGSTDGTRDLLGDISDPRVRVVFHDRNQGKGAALRTGFALATSD